MKKGFILGAILASYLTAMPVYAEPIDSSTWLNDDYVGIGAIDVPKLAQRRIYTYLMNFFVTDSNVRQAFNIIREAGIIFEDTVTRIVVGLPKDIVKSEHIVLWETKENLDKYRQILDKYSDRIDKRIHNGVYYYATKRENECLTIFDNILVLGSELKIKSIIDGHNSQFRNSRPSPALTSELRRVNKNNDAWLAFALGKTQQEVLGRGDPIIDLTQTGKGVINLGDIQSGNLSIDFSKGLAAVSSFTVNNEATAARAAGILSNAVRETSTDEDVKALGFDDFLKGLSFGSSKNDVIMTVNYTQKTFDSLIAFFTQFIKSVPGQPGSENGIIQNSPQKQNAASGDKTPDPPKSAPNPIPAGQK